MKEKIIRLANELNITEIGFTAAENAKADCLKYKTAITALFPYYVKDENDNGRISVYARGRDYHSVMREKLKPISDLILNNDANYADIYGDIGGLDDRNAAVNSGLGFIGRNGMLINDEYGSFVFIGLILTDMEFEFDAPNLRNCLNCGACEKYCIGGAISLKNGFDTEKCVSYISQKKGELTEAEKRLILKSDMCWGCDMCQLICPHNKGLSDTAFDEFKENRIADFCLDELYGMSNREFMRRYGGYAFSWRGIKPLLRNLTILDKKINN